MAIKSFIVLFLVSFQHVMPYLLPRHNYDESDGLEKALQLLEGKRLNGDDDVVPVQETLADIEESKLQKIIQEILEEQENPDEAFIENDELSPLGNNDEDYSEDDLLSGLKKRRAPRFGHRKPSLLQQLLEDDNKVEPMRFSHRKPRPISKRYMDELDDESDYFNFDKRFSHRKPYSQNYYRQKYRPKKRDTFDIMRDDDELEFEKKYSHRKPYPYGVKPRFKRDVEDIISEEDLSDIDEEKKWSHRKPYRKNNFLRPTRHDMEDYDLEDIDDFDKRHSHRKPYRKQYYKNYKREYDDFDDIFDEDKRFSHRKPSKYKYISKTQGRPKKLYEDNFEESEGSGHPSSDSYKNWMFQNYLQSLTPQTTETEKVAEKHPDAGELTNDANSDKNNNNDNVSISQSKNETIDSNTEASMTNPNIETEIGTVENKIKTIEDAVIREVIAMLQDAKEHGYTKENDPNAQQEYAHLVTAFKLDKLRKSLTNTDEFKKAKRNIPKNSSNNGKWEKEQAIM